MWLSRKRFPKQKIERFQFQNEVEIAEILSYFAVMLGELYKFELKCWQKWPWVNNVTTGARKLIKKET